MEDFGIRCSHHGPFPADRLPACPLCSDEYRDSLESLKQRLRQLVFAADKADMYPNKREIVEQYHSAKELARAALEARHG